jgi:DNA-binding response OmpR family regulator
VNGVEGQMRLLIVEDEEKLGLAMQDLFKSQGYEVDVVGFINDAIDYALSMGYDCVVMDVMLPDGNGIEAVTELRQLGCHTPILLLTVQNDAADRVCGLNAGADDYLGKPFDSAELLARVNALVRRAPTVGQTDTVKYGRAILHSNSQTLEVGSQWVELSSKEFALMEYLFRHPNQILNRDQLIAHLWGPDAQVSDNALDTYIYFLRKKANKLGFKSMIKTIRGQGYILGRLN